MTNAKSRPVFTERSITESLLKIGKNDLQNWRKWKDKLAKGGDAVYLEASHQRDILPTSWSNVFESVSDADWEKNSYWMQSLRSHVDQGIEYLIKRAEKMIDKATTKLAALGDSDGEVGPSVPTYPSLEQVWNRVVVIKEHDLKRWSDIQETLASPNGENAYLEMVHDRQIVGDGWAEVVAAEPDTDEYAAWLAIVKEHIDAVVAFQISNAKTGLERAKKKVESGVFD